MNSKRTQRRLKAQDAALARFFGHPIPVKDHHIYRLIKAGKFSLVSFNGKHPVLPC
jgi:hypothetical protein